MSASPAAEPLTIPKFGHVRIAIAVVIITVLCFWPGLAGPFIYDDWYSLARLEADRRNGWAWQIEDLLLAIGEGDTGPLGRPLALATFHLQAWTTALTPFALKLINLSIHLCNGFLVWWLVSLLYRSPRLISRSGTLEAQFAPVLVAAAWLLHPIQLTLVLYVVQRMASLSATFALLALIVFVHCRISAQNDKTCRFCLAVSLLFICLSVLAKETGALIPLYALAIELTLFRTLRLPHFSFRYFGVLLVLPALALAALPGERMAHYFSGYQFREWTLCERLLTEGQILWSYLFTLLIPAPDRFSLFHDDWQVLACQPLSLLPWLGLLSLTGLTLAAGLRSTVASFALLWFLFGHSLESTVLPLELAFEHRNYLPSLGPIWLIVATGLQPAHPQLRKATLAIWMASLILVLSCQSRVWSNPADLALHQVAARPNSALANSYYGRLLLISGMTNPENEENRRIGLRYYAKASALNPSDITAQVNTVEAYSRVDPTAFANAVDQLEATLRTRPLHQTSAPRLNQLMQTLGTQDQQAHASTVLRLYGAALSNPHLYPALKRNLLVSLARTYCLYGEFETAEQIFRELINESADHVSVLHDIKTELFASRMQRHDYRAALDTLMEIHDDLRNNTPSWSRPVYLRRLMLLLTPAV